MVILISFDIDGTLEVGDPPGVLSMDLVRRTKAAGILIGSCSDRPISGQRIIWEQHNITVDFAVSKQQLPDVKAKFKADVYYHIGDREDLDRQYALAAGFEFLWPDEALAEPWLHLDGDSS
ncbi:MAG: HAD family hydrolase [Chloroflexi bacterium]|nr:HAD family hydrolase [Chloroflexota bacterium]